MSPGPVFLVYIIVSPWRGNSGFVPAAFWPWVAARSSLEWAFLHTARVCGEQRSWKAVNHPSIPEHGSFTFLIVTFYQTGSWFFLSSSLWPSSHLHFPVISFPQDESAAEKGKSISFQIKGRSLIVNFKNNVRNCLCSVNNQKTGRIVSVNYQAVSVNRLKSTLSLIRHYRPCNLLYIQMFYCIRKKHAIHSEKLGE